VADAIKVVFAYSNSFFYSIFSGNLEELQGWTIFFIHQMPISLALQTLRLLLQKIITGRVKAHCFSKDI
jgi:hypothetical protein